MLAAALLATAAAVTTPSAAPPEARAALRLCLSLEAPDEESLSGCRQAALGLPAAWSTPVRAYLARRLAALLRWDEAIQTYRELADERPGEAEWPRRLGSALLFRSGRAAEAEAAFREALRRDGARAETWALLGCALAARGQHAEAVSAFERAEALDAEHLGLRPGLAEVFAAARRGESWP